MVAGASMAEYMANEKLTLAATTCAAEAYLDANLVIVATPTDFDPDKNHFDTISAEAVIGQAREHNSATTIPVGFTE